MDPLPSADALRLRAAEGWLELGNCSEAHAELDQITPHLRGHADVWIMRWQIHAKAKNWFDCLGIALGLTEGLPADPRGWLALGQTLRFQERLHDAFNIIVAKIAVFPTHAPIYYDAACYACLTGNLSQAKEFLELAAGFGDADEIRTRARADPDLEALWKKRSSS